MEIHRILDMAHYTVAKDFHQVNADAIIAKAGQGEKFVDPTFLSKIHMALDAGKIPGAFYFVDPRVDPILQADNFAATCLNAYRGPMLLGADTEELATTDAADAWNLIPKDNKAGIIFKFFWRLQKYYKGLPLHYISKEFYDKHLTGADFSAWPLWVADYTQSSAAAGSPRIPGCWKDWTFWQKTGHDTEPGLIGEADLDIFRGAIQDLKALACVPE